MWHVCDTVSLELTVESESDSPQCHASGPRKFESRAWSPAAVQLVDGLAKCIVAIALATAQIVGGPGGGAGFANVHISKIYMPL